MNRVHRNALGALVAVGIAGSVLAQSTTPVAATAAEPRPAGPSSPVAERNNTIGPVGAGPIGYAIGTVGASVCAVGGRPVPSRQYAPVPNRALD